MIICFKKKINNFCKKIKNNLILTQDYIQDLMPSCEDITCKCPNCKAKNCFSFHGSYMRNISFVYEKKIYDFHVCVTRVICNSCGSTHALLPDFIVPYKIFSRDSILRIVACACSSSVTKTAESFNTSWELIYSFLAIFLSFFSHVDSLNKDKKIFKTFNKTYFMLNCLVLCDSDFNYIFFKQYKWVFLMTKFQNSKSPPFTIEFNLISST